MIYVKVGEKQYPASITGRINDKEWNNRSSKAIKVEMTYQEALITFVDDIEWFILQENEVMLEQFDENGEVVVNENGEPILVSSIEIDSYDNSEYSIAGDIIDHRDGTVTVKMGMPTSEELLTMIVEGLAL